MRERYKLEIDNLLYAVKRRKHALFQELLWASFYRYGRFDGSIQNWNFGAEIANDPALNELYLRLEEKIKNC